MLFRALEVRQIEIDPHFLEPLVFRTQMSMPSCYCPVWFSWRGFCLVPKNIGLKTAFQTACHAETWGQTDVRQT